MNKAAVVFLTEEPLVHRQVESGVFIRDLWVQVSPLSAPSTRITVFGVPPFIHNDLLEHELLRFGKLASSFRSVSLGCKDPKLKHVQSLRRQVFMFLDSPTQTLDVSFRVKQGDSLYMMYASSGQIRCFECGDVGHKRYACPQKQAASGSASGCADAAGDVAGGAPGSESAQPSGPEASEKHCSLRCCQPASRHKSSALFHLAAKQQGKISSGADLHVRHVVVSIRGGRTLSSIFCR
ncbi:hypothetical protein F2P81_002217 [Scophthalmus maximus]|uniref:CCHC-type domain-containing protein n=1 Tax=Scophthalmus maximus TaxID=52904 RepID=A0A6A4TMU3_SCOMX|nr:hypothetical protein F2P81_002217 [Scophthalmus maximus]